MSLIRTVTAALTVAAGSLVLAAPAVLAAPSPHGEDTPLNLPAPTRQAEQIPGSSAGGSLVRTFVGLAVVIGVIYGLYWVLRQVKTSREEGSAGHGLAPIASIGLGPNRALHLVRAGRELVLVGVAEHAVTPIRTYGEDEARAAGLLVEPEAADGGDAAPCPAAPATRRQFRSVRDLIGDLQRKTVRR
jgi:flagellar protein FliO/FliZ